MHLVIPVSQFNDQIAKIWINHYTFLKKLWKNRKDRKIKPGLFLAHNSFFITKKKVDYIYCQIKY